MTEAGPFGRLRMHHVAVAAVAVLVVVALLLNYYLW
jgi:hypothetical protein